MEFIDLMEISGKLSFWIKIYFCLKINILLFCRNFNFTCSKSSKKIKHILCYFHLSPSFIHAAHEIYAGKRFAMRAILNSWRRVENIIKKCFFKCFHLENWSMEERRINCHYQLLFAILTRSLRVIVIAELTSYTWRRKMRRVFLMFYLLLN